MNEFLVLLRVPHPLLRNQGHRGMQMPLRMRQKPKFQHRKSSTVIFRFQSVSVIMTCV